MPSYENPAAIKAQAHLHHAYLLGLQLMVSTNRPREDVGEWMFRLFRRQHLDKFLSSFDKLGLSGEPDAVACAKYHVLSNNMGGVGVEYMYESDRKAWVRFRYPRWMYDGPTICGVPVEVSRGFLRGWYAHNGVSLGNPRLGFVCVSEDMTGEFGLCGYFKEFDAPLADDQRLQFAKGELPPPFRAAEQPAPPTSQWDALRLLKANRNYALDYIRNGLVELRNVIGDADCRELAFKAARLTGLQYYAETEAMVYAEDGDLAAAADYLEKMFSGMGDRVSMLDDQPEMPEAAQVSKAAKVSKESKPSEPSALPAESSAENRVIIHSGLRITRGLPIDEANFIFDCWAEIWRGTMSAQRQLKTLAVVKGEVVETGEVAAAWTISLQH